MYFKFSCIDYIFKKNIFLQDLFWPIELLREIVLEADELNFSTHMVVTNIYNPSSRGSNMHICDEHAHRQKIHIHTVNLQKILFLFSTHECLPACIYLPYSFQWSKELIESLGKRVSQSFGN